MNIVPLIIDLLTPIDNNNTTYLFRHFQVNIEENLDTRLNKWYVFVRTTETEIWTWS